MGRKDKSDAISTAYTPFTDSLYQKYPNAFLTTHGPAVGLPEGQMGNSEVGHLNLGAGRIVWQMLELINRSFETGEAKSNPQLLQAFEYCKAVNKPLHLLGLVSEGGVHSSLSHLFSLIDAANEQGVGEVYIHAFTDGRDTDPKSGLGYIERLLKHIEEKPNTHLATITGRYFAMDRDKRWERVKIAYDCLVNNIGELATNPLEVINNNYDKGTTDEFLLPIVLTNPNHEPIAKISEGDAVLFFNFRTDRGRQLTRVLNQEDFPEFGMNKLALNFATLTEYDKSFEGVSIIFDNKDIANTLGEVLANHGLKQVRAAETEKYPHVTFFFSGGREQEFVGETRIMMPSPKVATYDLQPQMSAPELKEALCREIAKAQADFFCINFANPDMVGHTGVYSAIQKAVETVDACVKDIVEIALQHNYTLLITADHGNADFAINDDGTPNTAHTTNHVPIWLVSEPRMNVELHNGILADVAPTLLKIMNIHQPKEMTGNALF